MYWPESAGLAGSSVGTLTWSVWKYSQCLPMKAILKQGNCVQQAGGGGRVRHELRIAPPPPVTGAEDVTAEGQAAA